jgi:hypothetical protein
LAERDEVVKALKHHVFLLKCVPSPAFLSQYQAIVLSGLAIRPLAMSSRRSSIQFLRNASRARTVI